MSEKDSASVQIRVYTFGELCVERRQADGTWKAVAPSEWGPTTYGTHTKSLLGYLLSCYKRQAPRSAIMEALWVNNPACVDDYLIRATSRLRTLLHDEQAFRLSANRFRYEIADQTHVWVDADHCEEVYREATRIGYTTSQGSALLEQAEACFRRGLFLEEEAGAWAHGRRGKLRSLHYDCLLSLAEAYEVQGHFSQAEHVAEALLHEDASDENALCHLMMALHQQGKTSEALRRYQETCSFLNQAGRRCSTDTEKLAKRLQQEPKVITIPSAIVTSPFRVIQKYESSSRSIAYDIYKDQNTVGSSALQRTPGLSRPTFDQHSLGNLFEEGIRAITLLGKNAQWSIEDMRIKIDQILKGYNDMDQQEQKDASISRREVLLLLTGLPSALMGLELAGITSPLQPEEITSLCLTTIPACWNLVYLGGAQQVEKVLPTYLTHLTAVVQQSSQHRKLAANLASQGYKLANLLALQREDFSTALKYSRDALTYGQIADSSNLQVAALIEGALTFWYRNRPVQALETYKEALQRIQGVSPIIEGRVYVGLAEAHAKLKQKQEALRYMNLAEDIFPERPENDSEFSYTHYNRYYLYLYKGLMYSNLDQPEHALKAYAHLHTPEYVARRTEIANREAAALLCLGDLHQCHESVNNAVTLALSIDSDLRYSEAYEVWQGMQIKWPHEQKVKNLAAFFQK